MTKNEFRILIVEDDDVVAQAYAVLVEMEGYPSTLAADGVQALALLQENPNGYGLIVSDLIMPNMDGYELCRAVKSNDQTKDIPFIIISSLDTLEKKLKGFEAGADDFVPKPVDSKILAAKIERMREIRAKQVALNARLAESQQVAMQAMTYSSDLGLVLEFYSKSLSAKSLEELASCLFDFMAQHGLRSSIQFHTPRGVVNFSDRGPMSPLEANVIEMGRQQTRFFDFEERTFINYVEFTLLVKNMPVKDREKYGMVKDTLGNLCNAIEARTKALFANDIEQRRGEIVATLHEMMADMRQALKGIQQANINAISEMSNDLDEAMMTLGLTGPQEDEIREIAAKTLRKIDDTFDRAQQLEQKFEQAQLRLDTIFGTK
ncbi:MAG: response regulator [Pseudomonadota bacterium]